MSEENGESLELTALSAPSAPPRRPTNFIRQFSRSFSMNNQQNPKKREFYEKIFNRFDLNHDGEINISEMRTMLENHNVDDLTPQITRRVFDYSDKDGDGRIDLDEFIALMESPTFGFLFSKYGNIYMRCIIPPQQRRPSGDVLDEGRYEDEYSCYPPKLAMIILSLVILTCFIIDEATQKDSTLTGSGVTAEIFIYSPLQKNEIWRFLTYMFVHIGFFHITVNLLVQLLLGVPLEMVHGWWRVLGTYLAGVVTGSLATAITDPTTRLAGASGGVYALITAHIAAVAMNWKEMSFPFVQLLVFVLVIFTDLGSTIYNRYQNSLDQQIGYVAHLAGAISGLLMGILILKNLVYQKFERYMWWSTLVLFVGLVSILIGLNIADVHI